MQFSAGVGSYTPNRKIADHGDFVRFGLQQMGTALIRPQLQTISHVSCESSISQLQMELASLRGQLEAMQQQFISIRQRYPGTVPLIGGPQYNLQQGDPTSQFKQQHFERDNLYYNQLAQYDRLRGVRSRDTIADRSHPQPIAGDKQSEIMMLRNEIQQTQLQLFGVRCQSSINPVEYQRAEDENEYLKSIVLAEAEILVLQDQPSSMQSTQSRATLLQLIQSKQTNIRHLQQQNQALDIPEKLTTQNYELQSRLKEWMNQAHMEKIQELAYLTVLRNQLQAESQQRSIILQHMQEQLTGQPLPAQTNELSDSAYLPQNLTSNRPVLLQQLLREQHQRPF